MFVKKDILFVKKLFNLVPAFFCFCYTDLNHCTGKQVSVYNACEFRVTDCW
jgi:hypothetical protein